MLFMFRNGKGIWRLRWKLLIAFAIVIVLVKSISTIRSNSQNDLQSSSSSSSRVNKEQSEDQQIDTKDNEKEARINWSPHGKININNEDAGGVNPDEKEDKKAPDVPVYNDDGDYPLPKYDKILNEKEG